VTGRIESKKRGITFDFSDLSFVYTVLFTLSLVLINRFGQPYGGIWTAWKFRVVIVLTVLTWTLLLLNAVRGKSRSDNASRHIGRMWYAAAGLWVTFLASGAVTVLLSPVTFRSARIANPEMGDGWLYWFCIALFVLGNALLLRQHPKLFRAQLYGFLIAGLLSAVAVFVQSIDWTIDFTDTSGRIIEGFRPLQTQSNVFKGFMPIGFTSNRGHVGFILAALAVLVLVCLLRGWLRKRTAWPLYVVFLAAIYLTSTRGVQLALIAGLIYLLVRFWRSSGGRRVMFIALAPLILGGALLASGLVGTGQARNLPALSDIVKNPYRFTSARTNFWPSAVDGIQARPLFGWGFNGFGLAWPHVNDFSVRWRTYLARVPDPERPGKTKPVDVVRILRNNHNSFEYLGDNGNVYRVRNVTNKAHNIILDTAVSVGLVGFGLYALLFGFFVYVTARGGGWGLEALAVVYVVFGLTWFESAQYSHLPWWALSVGLAFYGLPQALAKNEIKPVGRTIVVAPGIAATGD
jgi:O-antigen ligase